MENKFEFKDLINNILSGLLWEISIIMIVCLVNPEIVKNIDWEFIRSFNVSLFTFLIVFAFLLGIILRGTERPLTKLYHWLFGDPYYNVMLWEHPNKKKNIGFFYSIPSFEMKLKCLDKNVCNEVEIKLYRLKILSKVPSGEENNEYTLICPNPEKKPSLRNIGIMAERYLMYKKVEGPFIRFKDIKNLFESISFPLFLTLILAKWTLFTSMDCCSYFLILVVIFIFFILRYNYYYRNYVKDVFRMIFFAEV